MDIKLTESELLFAKYVETPFGRLRFLTYEEYLNLSKELTFITYNVLHFYYMILNGIPKHRKKERAEVEPFKELSLQTIVMSYPDVYDSYYMVLAHMLEPNEFINEPEKFMKVFTDIMANEEAFLMMRAYIMKMNLLKEEKVSPHPKLQEAFERDRKMREIASQDAPNNIDIVTSICALTSHDFEAVSKMTPFQVHNIYARISANKDYERNILFATVSQVENIESWAKKIDLFNMKDTSVISKDDFDSKYGSMFK